MPLLPGRGSRGRSGPLAGRSGPRLPLLALLLVAGYPPTLSCGGRASPPSLVVILVDTLRYDFLGCDGFQGPISPHVDALAGTSHLFRRAYSQAPWTKPSVASLFTSLYPMDHRVVDHEGSMWGDEVESLKKGVLSDSLTTMAEVLRDRGYRTAAFIANPWTTGDYGFDQGFEVFVDREDTSAVALIGLAEDWLQGLDGKTPFFLYLHFMEVHGPYAAPRECFEVIRNSPSLEMGVALTETDLAVVPPYLHDSDWVNPCDSARLGDWQGHYGAGMRRLDDELGPLLRRLAESRILDSSILVITSDHGEELHDHGAWGHGQSLYEELIHVPLLIRPPGGLARTVWHDGIVRIVDLMPTLLAMTGSPIPPGLDGRDLSPRRSSDRWSSADLSFSSATTFDPSVVALNVGAYKAIMNARLDTLQVFNVLEDPGERHDLAATKPRLTAELASHLRKMANARWHRLFEESKSPIPEFRNDQLRALGYLN